MTDDEAAGESKSVVNSVLRACGLLECFTHERPALTLGELAHETGLNKTTAHRLLATLVQAGWISQRADGAYKPTMRMFTVGSTALAELNLRDEAQPLLRGLAERFSHTAYLMVPAESGAVCIDLAEGSASLTIKKIAVGSVLPYHTAAGPTTMLAFSERLRERWLRRPLQRYTPQTVTDPDVLRAHLEKIADAGYTVSDEDYLEGVGAVAAPVFGAGGDLVATISLGGPAAHFRGGGLVGLIAAVRAAAAELTFQLGGGPPPERG
ncbi:IclR family transcriptional regulator [Streptomonospora sp. S1-112]|uniref:Glycerol operon regulatory protein n=1 Tax=Streptomonospora mangrovi TaxID=2883123 RepID=A0A9X3NLE2_9ACTN|nr:IclR family transcriptional regulator [Streptomonospora mangrovi]MDA0564228.1 IclR family transcriptional regulator [Streptomonospora mangrovi]